jgi:hypothetical protein
VDGECREGSIPTFISTLSCSRLITTGERVIVVIICITLERLFLNSAVQRYNVADSNVRFKWIILGLIYCDQQ